jgi:hypothetical protein
MGILNSPAPCFEEELPMRHVFLPLSLITLLSGCINMPTPTSQITGAQSSGIEYEQYDCSRLGKEMASLSRRENQLTIAQEQRIKSSQMQAIWTGFGQGDGIEAMELANVRGKKEAIQSMMTQKDCSA